MNHQQGANGGMSVMTILFLIFLVLKLTNVIAWSWWWVTCPLWFGFAAWACFAVFFVVVGCIAALCS